MLPLRDLSISRKVLLIILMASGISLLVTALAVVLYEETTFRPRVLNDLEAQADFLRVNMPASLVFDDPLSAEENLSSLLRRRPEISAGCVYTADGQIFAAHTVEQTSAFFFPPLPESPGPEFRGDELYLFRPIEFENEVVGHLFLRYDLPPLFARLPQYTLMVSAVLFALQTVSLLLLVFLKRVISAPILELAQAARDVRDRQDYGVRVSAAGGRDEIGSLSDSFNEMLATIQQREAALRRANTELESHRQDLQHELAERKRAEEALRESERFAQQIADFMPSLLYVQDLAERRNTYINREVQKILGYSPEAVIARGQEPFEVPRPDDPMLWSDRLARLQKAKDGEIIETEYQMKHAKGESRWLVSRDTVFGRDETGAPRYVLGVARDVTERKSLQAQLIQAQKMESIGRLAGGVAHDFNNLLTVIIGSTDLVLSRLPQDSKNRSLLENVLKASTQATDLTHQLLAFARKQIIEPRVLSLNRLLLDSEKMLRSLIGDDIDLAVITAAELWPVKADPGQMMQVFMNMTVNARDAMPRGGRLTIETSNAVLTEEQVREHPGVAAGEYAHITVSDTGIGIDELTMTHIFEPFFTTKDHGKGTGLGLATCYGIIKQSGGHLVVDSQVGKGTRFNIYLQHARNGISERQQKAVRVALPAGEETVLVVEDNALVRATAVKLLRAHGYTVLEAADGPDALRLESELESKIDLLITDVVMPRMSGKEVAERLVEKRPGLKVLYVSGYTTEAIVQHGTLERGIAFLQKPYTSEVLMRKVRAVLDG